MGATKRDSPIADLRVLRRPGSTLQEVRAALAEVVYRCRREGVRRLQEVVIGEEPVFYVDDER